MARFNPCIPVTTTPQAPTHLTPTAPAAVTPLVIGSRVHCILYGGMDGIVFNIRGQQRPETVGTLGAGVVVHGGEAQFDIVFTGEHAHKSVIAEAIVRGSVQWRVQSGVASADEIQQALTASETRAQQLKADTEAKARKQNAERAALPGQYPYLTTVAKSGKSSHAQGAANLKLELQRAFPGVKFSVKSESYTGGDSISVRWHAGPTTKQVEALSGKYQEGRFDGMADCYDYDHDNVWPGVFGGAKYVSEARDFPMGFREQVARSLCALQGKVYNENDFELQRETNELLSRTPFATGARFERVEYTPEAERPTLGWCRVVFAAPIAPSAPAAAPAGSGITLVPTKHTKTGAAIWVVQLADRVDRSEYERINQLCREHGGYYSSYRGHGAVPGFTFKVQASAEAFMALLVPTPPAAPAEMQKCEISQSEPPPPAEKPALAPVEVLPPLPADPEAELRRLWTAQGVPQGKQDAIIADTIAKAQPGAMVGPFQIPPAKPIPQIPPLAGCSPLGLKIAPLGNCSKSRTEPACLSGQATVPAWRRRRR